MAGTGVKRWYFSGMWVATIAVVWVVWMVLVFVPAVNLTGYLEGSCVVESSAIDQRTCGSYLCARVELNVSLTYIDPGRCRCLVAWRAIGGRGEGCVVNCRDDLKLVCCTMQRPLFALSLPPPRRPLPPLSGS